MEFLGQMSNDKIDLQKEIEKKIRDFQSKYECKVEADIEQVEYARNWHNQKMTRLEVHIDIIY